MILQKTGNSKGIRFVLTHTYRQSLYTPQGKPYILRTGNGTNRILEKPKLLVNRRIIQQHRPAYHIRVPRNILGSTLHHNIRPQLQRTLKIGRGKGIIHRQQHTACPGNGGHCLYIHNCKQRIGGRFQPDQLRVAANGPFKLLRITPLHIRKGNTVTRKQPFKQTHRPAVHIGNGNDMVAGVEQ